MKSSKKNKDNDTKSNSSESENSPNLYSLLDLPPTCTQKEIREQYKKLVFLCHPDKTKNNPELTEKFRNIQKAYEVLSNPDSRKIYDETGNVDDEHDQIEIEETLNYFRKIYSTKDIDDFAKKYVNSKEEEEDLINFYNEYNGDMTSILECIPLSENKDIERYMKIYDKLFKEKVLKKNKKFTETKNKIKLLNVNAEEQKEAEDALSGLRNMIMKRQEQRYNYLDKLAEKYGGGKVQDDIDDEEFERIKQSLHNKRKK